RGGRLGRRDHRRARPGARGRHGRDVARTGAGGRAPAVAEGGPGADLVIERALISTFDKTGLEEFASGLVELGVEVVASGGTADYLAEHGIEVKRVEELTEIP